MHEYKYHKTFKSCSSALSEQYAGYNMIVFPVIGSDQNINQNS